MRRPSWSPGFSVQQVSSQWTITDGDSTNLEVEPGSCRDDVVLVDELAGEKGSGRVGPVTWRGLVASLVVACVLSEALGFGYLFGLVFGSLVMTGDLFSSFVKRRRGLAPGDQSLGLDQLPESIAPTLYAVAVTGIQWWWAILLPLAFMLLELAVSRPLYWLKIRKRPY